jgi:hypothetical protein
VIHHDGVFKGELHPCAGAPMRTSEEWRLSDPRENIAVFLAPLLSSNYFLALLSLLVYIRRIAMLE